MGCRCTSRAETKLDEESLAESDLAIDIQEYDDSEIPDFGNFNSATLRSVFSHRESRLFLTRELTKEETFRMSGALRRPTLSFASSLAETAQFRIGNELLCMTWNIHHDTKATPFDFYCDFRIMGVKERCAVSIEILWDVARVFFFTPYPTMLCKSTKLRSLVPAFLLLAFSDFCVAANVPDEEKEKLMSLPNGSLYDFLTAHFFNQSVKNLVENQFSLIQLHRRNRDRKTSPLRLDYEPADFNKLLKSDLSILPVLILDCLHIFVINFSGFLIDNRLRQAFSEYEPEDQIQALASYLEYRGDTVELGIPKLFRKSRKRLYEKWRLVFQETNKIEQLLKKAGDTESDIILLQQVTAGAYKELVKQSSEAFDILPHEFPATQNETTVICLRKKTVQHERDKKIKRFNDQNFAVLCKSGDIHYYVCVVNLTPGEKCGKLRKREALRLMRTMGKNTPVIVGGNFNEDLTAFENPVAKIMLREYNGIDHTQDEPLVFSVNRTRTNLHFEVARSDQQDQAVNDGIFSSFPLIGQAFTNFIQTGMDNPSDHGPVFQRIILGLF